MSVNKTGRMFYVFNLSAILQVKMHLHNSSISEI
jgi:hypothetical protein